MPSLQGGRSGEVRSYMELVNGLFRKYANAKSLSDHDALFHGASQEEEETENEFYERLRELLRLCGYIHTEGQKNFRYTPGLGWEIHAGKTTAICRWTFCCSMPRGRVSSVADFRRNKRPTKREGPGPVEIVEPRGRNRASALRRR